jgi:predicted DCC family thiol-disulfide oxidoreductase YuxK
LAKYLLAYDTDCGPCTKFKQGVDFLDKYNKIDFLSLNDADSNGMLESVPKDLRFQSFHLIFPDGRVLSGADALLDLIGILPAGIYMTKLIRKIPYHERLIGYIYKRIAQLRQYSSCNLNYKDTNR